MMSYELCSPMHCNICLMLKVDEESLVVTSPSQYNKTKFSDLRVCSGCQLIRYCGKEHQLFDWSFHAEFCHGLQKIMKQFKLTNPFTLNGAADNEESMERNVTQLKYILRHTLKRSLEHREEELTAYPAYCPVCFKLKNFKIACPQCQSQAYCSVEHMEEHKEEHRKNCAQLQLYYCPYKMIQGPYDLYKKFIEKTAVDMSNLDLYAVFEQLFKVELPIDPTKKIRDFEMFSFASDFSCITTLCFALSHLDISAIWHAKKSRSFVVYILGPTVEAVMWFREIHCKYFFLQYPYIHELELYFIGPELTKPDHDILKFDFLGHERLVHFNFHKCLYQDFCQSFTQNPDIFMAYNCGFSEHSVFHVTMPNGRTKRNYKEFIDDHPNETWFKGLVQILQTTQIPIVFSSFTEQESEFDLAALNRAAEHYNDSSKKTLIIEPIFEVKKNPYHCFRPLRIWFENERFFYRNGYLKGIVTKFK